MCGSAQNAAVAMASPCMVSVKVGLIESIKREAQRKMFTKPFSGEIVQAVPSLWACFVPVHVRHSMFL